MTLRDFFDENKTAALAFSGGMDSSYLLYAANAFGARVQPYFIKTAFQPQRELDLALGFCGSLGISLKVLECDIFAVPEVAVNTQTRCYHCKKALFKTLLEQATRDGFPIVTDGTNASDNENERPGMRALSELSIRSPLRECGLSKEDVLRLSAEAGLPIKPSYSCLATRIPHGSAITGELLSRALGAENALLSMGFSDFRARVFHNAVKLEIKADQMQEAISQRDAIIEALAPFCDTVLLDLRAR